jgi:predicted RNA-binding Zn ribbon-like protein
LRGASRSKTASACARCERSTGEQAAERVGAALVAAAAERRKAVNTVMVNRMKDHYDAQRPMASTRLRPLLYPAALELVNSRRPGVELLDEPGWLEGSLERWELAPGRAVTRAEREAIRRLRDLLRRLTERVAEGAVLDEAERAELNEVLARAPVRASLVVGRGEYALAMTPVADSWLDEALRELAGSFAAMLLLASPTRLKLCENEQCGTAFWDTTRSRTRRWCTGAGCGNRIRARRHRARRNSTRRADRKI